MYILGITGGIATGKSTVTRYLRELGACIVDVDDIAHQVIFPGSSAWQEIVKEFGEGILQEDRKIQRKKLGELVFANDVARTRLEEITHPKIYAWVKNVIEQEQDRGLSVIVLDVPLLFEAKWQNWVDEIWVVAVDYPVQIERLICRNHVTKDYALQLIKSQIPLTEKIKLADVVIDNAGSMENTFIQVQNAWQSLLDRIK